MPQNTASAFEATIEKNYPGAMRARQLVDDITRRVQDLGHAPSTTKPTLAVCRDDSIEDVRDRLQEAGYMSVFNMHTLAGHSDVAGKTSIGAWYHHFADDGMGLLLYGPHVGIDSQGRVGFLDREGREAPGHSCGALWAIGNAWENGDFGPYEDDPGLSAASRMLASDPNAKNAIMQAPIGGERVQAMAERMYTAGRDLLVDRVTRFQDGEEHQHPILLVAGINLDLRHDEDNAFHVRDVYVIQDGEVADHEQLYKTE